MDVERVMSRDVVSVGPATSLRDVARLLAERRISGMPVVADGAILGVVSAGDVLRRRHGTAAEAMTSPAVCIRPDRPLWEAADLMLRRRVNRLPVADVDGELVGIVSRADLVRAFARPDYEIESELAEELEPAGIDVEVVGGEATLRGVVATRAIAAAALVTAARAPGVLGVRSRLISGR